LTGYSDDFDVSDGFRPSASRRLGESSPTSACAAAHCRNRKISARHFLFQRREEISFPGEDRVLVPSPDVATYDLKPEMSAFEVTDKLLAAINGKQYDVIVCNYANPDMVGHTGDLQAAIKAIETVDICLGRVVEAQLARGGEVLVTADHGNADHMRDAENRAALIPRIPLNLVPLIYIGRRHALPPKPARSKTSVRPC